jgi:hypothetical protein
VGITAGNPAAVVAEAAVIDVIEGVNPAGYGVRARSEIARARHHVALFLPAVEHADVGIVTGAAGWFTASIQRVGLVNALVGLLAWAVLLSETAIVIRK